MTQVELPFERLSTRTPSARGAARPVEWRSEFSFGCVSVSDGGSIGGDGDGGRGVVAFAQSRLRRSGHGGDGGDIIGGDGCDDGASAGASRSLLTMVVRRTLLRERWHL